MKMYDRQKVLNIALAEVGYLEKTSRNALDDKTANAGNANITKYARDLDAISFYNGRKQGVAWCDVFVDWCFVQAYGKLAALKMTFQPTVSKNNAGAGVKWSRKYYEQKGQFFHSPQVGDQIFFGTYGSETHTGLVYKVDGSRVYTVEGNTSGASGVVANGGGVFKKSYSLSHGRICGYGRPAYGVQTAAEPKQEPPKETEESADYTLYTVKKGDTLWRIAQKLLGRGNRYKEIKQLNGMQSDKILAGQTIKIPKKA